MPTMQVNGIELSYERAGEGRRALVLVHGYPLDHTIWMEVVPWLAGEFDLILPDLRGFGRSGLGAGRHTLSDMAADLVALLDGLNMPKAILAGHSMGGYVTLAFAARWPERLAGLGLISSQALADAPEKAKGRYEAAGRILQSGVQAVADEMPRLLTAREPVRSAVHEVIARQRPVGLAGALQAMAERADSMEVLAGAELPILLLHGLADELIPVERAREIKRAVPAASLVELVDVGHMPMLEAPRETSEALKAFGN